MKKKISIVLLFLLSIIAISDSKETIVHFSSGSHTTITTTLTNNLSKSKNFPIISQYFVIFNDGNIDNFHKALALTPPFKYWNITDIGFIHTYFQQGEYVADYENARGGKSYAIGDSDQDRIQQLIHIATDTNAKTNPNNYWMANPNMKFLITLGWGKNDFSNASKTPIAFANSVCKIIRENNLDGLDIDYESDSNLTPENFTKLSDILRSSLNQLSIQMGKKLYLTITPVDFNGLDVDTLNRDYDYIQLMSYSSTIDGYCDPNNFVGVDRSKILIGRDYENGDTMIDSRYPLGNVVSYVIQQGYAGVMGWRVDTGSQLSIPPYFQGTRDIFFSLYPKGKQ